MREALEGLREAFGTPDATKQMQSVACCLAVLDAIRDGEVEAIASACAEITEIYESCHG